MRPRQAMNEIIRRMAEPEPYRTLRLQRERLEHEAKRRRSKQMYDLMAASERAKIIALGEKPVA